MSIKIDSSGVKDLYAGGQKIVKAYVGQELVLSEKKPSRLPEGYTEVQYIACNTPPSGYAPYIVYYAFMRKTINGKNYGLNAESVFSYPEVLEGSGNKTCHIIYAYSEIYSSVYTNYILRCNVYSPSNSTESLKNKHRIYAGVSAPSSTNPGNFETYSSLLENKYEERTKVTLKFKPESMKFDIYENDILVYDSGNTSYTNPLTNFRESVRYPITIFARRGVTAKSNTFWGKLFYLKLFFEDGTIVGELIPCKRNSDNMIGLYDLVTDEFCASEVNETYLYAGPAVSSTKYTKAAN